MAILGIHMSASTRTPLFLAAALLVAQPAFACCCLDDLAWQSPVSVAADSCCNEPADSPERGCTNPSECPDCADLNPAPTHGSLKAVAANLQFSFKLPMASLDLSSTLVRPQTVRIIGPPPAVPRPAQTPVVLKQRLLI